MLCDTNDGVTNRAKYDLNDFISAHKVKIAIVANIPKIPLYLGVIMIVRACLKKVCHT